MWLFIFGLYSPGRLTVHSLAMKLALAQINPTVGALRSNADRILAAWREAGEAGADLVVFPELALTGYPPRDLLDLPEFVRANLAELEGLAGRMSDGPGAIVGYVQPADEPTGTPRPGERPLYNAAGVIDGGAVIARHYKTLLPTYDVFDEDRYFTPAPAVHLSAFRGKRLAVTICEDLWSESLHPTGPRYDRDPLNELGALGPDLIVHLAASPYSVGKRAIKTALYRTASRRWGCPLAQVNMVGGNDNLIFDGWSNLWNRNGNVAAQAAAFREEVLVVDTDAPGADAEPDLADTEETLYGALVLGIRDYVTKCGFGHVVIGLSGGIDSALTAVLAADALGPENVTGVAMPSRFSSEHSVADAEALARNLGIDYRTIAIDPIVTAFEAQLAPHFEGLPFGLAEENLQARARGNLLMALSNKFNWLVLATGNKSELAVGYCTLYGDMVGGLAVLGDVLKTQVYDLSRWVNREGERIPRSTIEKPPSAELRPDQKDSDSLPDYAELDPIVQAYVEEHTGPEALIAAGHDEATVRRVLKMIDRAEYKRQQAAVCLKVTSKAFGPGRRMPIARG